MSYSEDNYTKGTRSIPSQPLKTTPVTLLFKITNPFTTPAPVDIGGTGLGLGIFKKGDLLYGSAGILDILSVGNNNDDILMSDGIKPTWSSNYSTLDNNLTLTLDNHLYSYEQSNKLLIDATNFHNRLDTLSNIITTQNNTTNSLKSNSDQQALDITDIQAEINIQNNNLSGITALVDSVSNEGLLVSDLEVKVSDINDSLNLVDDNIIGAQYSINHIVSGVTTSGQYKNKIINGNFKIWQYNTSFSGYLPSSVSYLTADRWAIVGSLTTYVVMNRSSSIINKRMVDSLQLSFAGAGNKTLRHYIENVRTLQGKLCTISFWARSDGPFTLNLVLKQVYSTNFGGIVVNVINTDFNITNTFQQFSYTFNMPSIPINATIGSINFIQINFSNSSNWQIEICNIQLENGNLSDFEYHPIHTELMLCQRYYEIGYAYFLGYAVQNTYQYTNCAFKIDKRITPTIILEQIFRSSFTNTLNMPYTTVKQVTIGCLKNTYSNDGTYNIKFIANSEINN